MNSQLKIFEFAKLQALLTTLLGAVAGIIYSFGGIIIDTLVSLEIITSSETPGLSIGTLYAFGALIGMPMIFGLVGYIAGIVEAFLYNILIRYIIVNKINIYK